jgi:hypothetical protein
MINILVFGAGIFLGAVTNNIYRDLRDFEQIDESD